MTFEGGSPKVRKEAGLPDLDEVIPDRNIKALGITHCSLGMQKK
ncbi:hypothetical protein B4064_1549 [Caldibacillus thermoamylovorans]|uniref:Uncharacterized protein n=1 Tax=Caldibacillus thermoamylovorans TaxID=35841 RepID=A0A0D0FE74_9BACI|nr:hypothetical protein B4166_0806 [Caldibacillus thermoamylovorans]KIO62175.1 hypothetical protein B4065_3395 [Caldibacillus thermoamylovorans]KIO68902.1 hypothetical protein B4064_1549 [Caldibacillus thermoamylovorans]KIO70149.1 hypothetical protein B4167_0841 [Caldibacillus thermoamylovorans]